MERELDVVVLGATGLTGGLVAEHLAASAPAGLRIGLAGRSRERLQAVRSRLGPAAADWPLLLADSTDPASLRRLASATRVLASTAGPYLRHGLPLVEACARAGTHCADLTGEVLFVRRSIDAFAATAAASGARIVHCCGFDSVPSDLAVLLTHLRAREEGAGELTDATMCVTSLRGGVSGGTLASARLQREAARADPDARRLLADPHALSPDRRREPDLGAERDRAVPARRADLGGWSGPFVMAPCNTRVVRRSNALLDHAYGRRLRYEEVRTFTGRGAGLRAVAATAALGVGLAALAAPASGRLVERLLPPGAGPGERARRDGRFRMVLRARTDGGARYATTVAASADPGYAATAVMLGQGVLALALDADELPDRAGVLTPATGIGTALARRLRREGFTLDVVRQRSAG